MTLRLSASGETKLDSKDVVVYSSIVIDGVTNTDVISYDHSVDKNFGASSLTITLANDTGKYGANGASVINRGDSVTLTEGIYNNLGVLETFNKFTGVVRNLAPQSSSGNNTIQITALDKICKLEDMGIDSIYESGSCSIQFMPGLSSGGVKLLESMVDSTLTCPIAISDTKIYLDTTAGFEIGEGYLGSVTSTNLVTISAVGTTTLTVSGVLAIHSAGEVARQSLSQTSSKKNMAFYFDFGYWDANSNDFPTTWGATTYYFHSVKNISPTNQPSITIKPSAGLTVYKDPQYDGFEINWAEGQVVFGTPIDLSKYEIWSSFYYYSDAGMNYAEDIIETMLTTVDGYGNAEFTSADYTSTLLAETGASTDNLTYNRGIVRINDVDYAIGTVYYMTYNNITTALVSGNFTVPAGKTISSIDLRYGRVILNSAVASPADGDVVCNVNYSFKTIQTTGVKIPVITFAETQVRNRFEAFQELKKQLSPNYSIYIDGNGKVWGKHLRQKYTQDYTLDLMQSIQYTSDTEIYTRVKVFGENAVPRNAMLDGLTSSPYACDDDTATYVTGYPLCWTGTFKDFNYSKWGLFTLPASIIAGGVGRIEVSPNYPTVWINGVRNSTWAIDGVPFQTWGHIVTGEVNDGFWFDPAIGQLAPIVFYKGDTVYSFKFNGTTVSSITPGQLHLEWDTENHRIKWIPANDRNIDTTEWISDDIKNITTITMNISYNDAWMLRPPNQFYIKTGYMNKEQVETKDVSVKTTGGASLVNGIVGQGTYNNGPYPGPSIACDGSDGTLGHIIGYGMVNVDDSENNYIYLTIPLNGYNFVQSIDLKILNSLWRGSIHFYYKNLSSNWIRIERRADVVMGIWKRFYGGYDKYFYRFNFDGVYYTDEIQVRFCCDSGGKTEWTLLEFYINGVSAVASNITTDFWYKKSYSPPVESEIRKLHDGKWDTQSQSVYEYKPTTGTRYLIFNIAQEVQYDGTLHYPEIGAIDITGGWYIPNPDNPNLKFDINNKYTVEYYNGSAWLSVCNEASNFDLASGKTVKFEKDALGDEFRPQKLAIKVDDVGKIEGFGSDKYVISFVEFSAYENVTLKGESKLIPKTVITAIANISDTTVYGTDFTAFDSIGTAYIESDAITYTGKTTTTLTGVAGINSSHAVSARVSQYLETTNPNDLQHFGDIYDPDHLLVKIGDKLYIETEISKYLNTQSKILNYSKLMLRELTKNITTVQTPVLSRPDSVIGDTVQIDDTVNQTSATNYFVEGISSNNGMLQFKLSKYFDIVQEDSQP